jgi:hypothetical protein
MKRTLLAVIAAAGLITASAAQAQERLIDGALGAGAGALVGGPVGAVAGGAIGYGAGPRISRGFHGRRHYRHRRYRHG